MGNLGYGIRALALVGAMAMFSMAPSGARAQAAKSPTIGVVSFQIVMQEAEAAKSIRRQFADLRKEFQEEVVKREEILRATDQELAGQRAILSADAFEQKRKELEKSIAEAQKYVQKTRKSLDQAQSQAMTQVQRTVIDVIREIAEEKGLQLVLHEARVVVFDVELNFSKETLARVNERMPDFTVERVAQ